MVFCFSLLILGICYYKPIYVAAKRLYRYQSSELLKSSDFKDYTVDVYFKNQELLMELYSSRSDFSGEKAKYPIPIEVLSEDVTISWYLTTEKSPSGFPVEVVILSVQTISDGTIYQEFQGVFADGSLEIPTTLDYILDWSPEKQTPPVQVD